MMNWPVSSTERWLPGVCFLLPCLSLEPGEEFLHHLESCEPCAPCPNRRQVMSRCPITSDVCFAWLMQCLKEFSTISYYFSLYNQ